MRIRARSVLIFLSASSDSGGAIPVAVAGGTASTTFVDFVAPVVSDSDSDSERGTVAFSVESSFVSFVSAIDSVGGGGQRIAWQLFKSDCVKEIDGNVRVGSVGGMMMKR